MTNSTIVSKSNLPNANKTSAKKSNHSEKSSTDQIVDDFCSSRGKSEIKTVSGEQVLKKTTSKSRNTRRNKKVLERKKQETEQVEHKTTTDKSQASNECKNEHVKLTNNEKNIKENRICNVNKCKIVTFNHKLTEYFSDLKVNEHVKDVSKEENVIRDKVKNNKNSSGNTINNNPPIVESVRNSPRILKKHKNKLNSESTNHKVTEYFQVRRSERKYTKKIIDEKQIDLEKKIINEVEDGLEIKEFNDKGRGIITTKEFCKGDFVIEYIGDLINGVTAKERELQYARNKNIGCYMYYFKYKNIQYCIDATEESGKLGRLINHSRKGNLVSRIIEINQIPHLVLFAKTNISIGAEILYDYGDRSREAVRNYPWLTL